MGEWLKIGATGGTGGAASPGAVSLTAITVLERYTEDGKRFQRLGVEGTAPSPIASFVGVHVYGEIPAGSLVGQALVDTAVVGTSVVGPERQALDLGKFPYSADDKYLAVFSVPDVAQPTPARFYAPSYAAAVENQLVYADQASPSPHIEITLTPMPAYISGEEYAPLATGFSMTAGYPYYELRNNVWTYQTGFQWMAPTSSPRYDRLTGYEVVFEYADGSRSPAGPTPRDAVTWVSEPPWQVPLAQESIIAWLCSVGEGGRNSIVEGVTPKLTFTVQRPLDPTAGREYAPPVTGFTATAPKTTSVDGVEVYGFTGSWDAPTSPEVDQVHIWAHETTGNTWHDLGVWLASDAEFRTDQWPLNGTPTFDLYALSVAPDGRANTLVDGVTPKVAGLAVTAGTGALKANRLDLSTLGAALDVIGNLLAVKVGPALEIASDAITVKLGAAMQTLNDALTVKLGSALEIAADLINVKTGGIVANMIQNVNAEQINGLILASQIQSISAGQITGLIAASQINNIASTQITGLIVASQIQSVAAGQVTGLIVASQIQSVNANQINGLVIANQIQSLTVGQLTGLIVGSQIAEATIGSANIASLAVEKLLAGTMTVGSGGVTFTGTGGVTIAGSGNLTVLTGTVSATGASFLSAGSGFIIHPVAGGLGYISGDGFIDLTGASAAYKIAGSVVINASTQFVGAGVYCPSYGVAASGFNPYYGGQYYGVADTGTIYIPQSFSSVTRLIRLNAGNLEYSDNGGSNWNIVDSSGVGLALGVAISTSKAARWVGGSLVSMT